MRANEDDGALLAQRSRASAARYLTALTDPEETERAVRILNDHLAVAAGLLAGRSNARRAMVVLMNVMDALRPEAEREFRLSAHRTIQYSAVLFCAKNHITMAELKGPGRHQSISRLRQEFMVLARDTTSLSLPQIGAFLGGRDHTTILHGIRAHRERMSEAANAA